MTTIGRGYDRRTIQPLTAALKNTSGTNTRKVLYPLTNRAAIDIEA